MSRAIFAFLVVLGVIFSTVSAQQACGQNEEWTSCGTACPLTCAQPTPRACTANCVIGCQCKQGYLLNASGQCVLTRNC